MRRTDTNIIITVVVAVMCLIAAVYAVFSKKEGD